MTDSKDHAEKPRRLTREEARRQTHERLLDAAAEVFKRLGYSGASLDAVAEAAGYTKGAVYSNFATKADLFIALLERYVAQEAATQGAQLESGSIEDFIDGLDKTLEHQTRSDPEWVLLNIEFFLAAARDPVIRAKYIEDDEEMREASGKTLDAKLDEIGVKSPFTGRELGILLNALGAGLALGFHLEPEALDPKLYVRAARVLFGLDANRASGAGFRVSIQRRKKSSI
jgi:AcrR family transcriptional regulator